MLLLGCARVHPHIALQAAGVLAVFVGADLAADGLGTLPTYACRRRRRVVECPACAFAIG